MRSKNSSLRKVVVPNSGCSSEFLLHKAHERLLSYLQIFNNLLPFFFLAFILIAAVMS